MLDVDVAVTLAARMMRLFEGYSAAYGTYTAEAAVTGRGGKVEIKPTVKTLKNPVTRELWERHLAGTTPLGIIPIRDNDTCLWGVVDVDVYDLDFDRLMGQVRKHELPLVTCRSKSGGAHLFIFLEEPVSAEQLKMRLREMAALIGYGQSEIFPKQTHVDLDRGDLGSWLNMPYFEAAETSRFGMKAGGMAMDLAEFLHVAENARVPTTFLERSFRKVHEVGEGKARRDPDFGDGPPCMQHLTAAGFPEGTRNKGLFALAIFAKRKHGERWREVVEKWNQAYLDPPLGSEEVLGILKSNEKNNYNYPCKDHPLSAHCNSTLCLTRRFGVGGSEDYPMLSGLSVIKSSPPLWFADVGEKRIELATDQLQNYNLFHRACMEQLFVCYKMMRQSDWIAVVSVAMRDAVEITVSPEVGVHGHFEELLEDFVNNRHRGENKEDILLGRPWFDISRGRHWFRLRDLMRSLAASDFKVLTRTQVAARIRALSGDREFTMIKGKGVNVWWIPDIFTNTPPADVPVVRAEPI